MLKSLKKFFFRPYKVVTQVVFYASSSVDELWIRTTALRAKLSNVDCVVVIGSGRLNSDVEAEYKARSIQVYYDATLDFLRSVSAEMAVTATSGVPASWFSEKVMWRVHMPHSIASLHMIYPEGCFDGYNVLFAVGPHHKEEFERISHMRGLGDRLVIPVGYGKLDVLYSNLRKGQYKNNERPHVLLAPSWGPGNIISVMGVDLIKALLDSGFSVTLRPHPLFFIENDTSLGEIKNEFLSNSEFFLESSLNLGSAIYEADILVTDYSGTAQEFVALRTKPVVFVDVQKKVVNPTWKIVGIDPIELRSRNVIGPLAAANVGAVSKAVPDVLDNNDRWINAVTAFKPEFLYKDECSDSAVRAICRLLAESYDQGAKK